MPVFKNASTSNGDGTKLAFLTGDEMIKKAKEVAKAMSLNINTVYTQPTKEEIEADEKKTGEKAKTNPSSPDFFQRLPLCRHD